MPFPVPTPQELREQCESEIKAEFPTAQPRLVNSFLGVLCKAFSLAFHGMYIYLTCIADQIFVSTSSDENLDLHGTEVGVDRREATASSGTVQATGVDASVIPIGAELVDGNGQTYETTESVAIAGGVASVAVESVTFGSATNQLTGVNLNFVSPAAGVDTLTTVEAPGIEGGADRESDESYRDRIIERKRRPIQCGTASDYEQWALEVPDVTRAFVFPQEDGVGTVRVRFMMDDKYANGIPQPVDVAAVEANIMAQMPINVDLFVSAPVPVTQDIDVRVSPFNPDVVSAVEAELNDLFQRDTVPGGELLISRIREAVSNAPGEENNIVDNPTTDVTVGSTSDILVPGTYTITAI